MYNGLLKFVRAAEVNNKISLETIYFVQSFQYFSFTQQYWWSVFHVCINAPLKKH